MSDTHEYPAGDGFVADEDCPECGMPAVLRSGSVTCLGHQPGGLYEPNTGQHIMRLNFECFNAHTFSTVGPATEAVEDDG